MSEATVLETPQHDTTQTPVGIKPRGDVVVVDNTNFHDYVGSKLPPPVADVSDAEIVDESIEGKAKAELKEVQKQIDANNAPKDGDTNAEGDIFLHGKWHDSRSFTYRLHKATEEKAKEAAAKIAEAEGKTKAEREARDKAEREARELRDKYEPPKQQELGPKPVRSQFVNEDEYDDALVGWAADKTRHDDRVKADTERQTQERERVSKEWESRRAAFNAKNPDAQAKIDASPVRVSGEMQQAIIESEVGPEILEHLADNPDIADRLGKLSVRKMLVEFGKLETTIQGSAEKPTPKSETPAPTLAEVSKAPAPITPLRGASAPGRNYFDKDGQFTGTAEEWRTLRTSGKIK